MQGRESEPVMDFSGEVDSLITASVSKPGAKTCSIGFILSQLNEAQREKFEELLESNVRGTTVSALLQRYGYVVSSETVQRHRRRKIVAGCRCP
jgi:hypothetical protein